MRFVTRVLLVQLATLGVVVAVCAAVFGVLAVQQLRAGAESSGLAIARTVAADDGVRALVALWSADPGTPDAAQLRGGELQAFATDVAARTGALFVVITDDHGIRLAHPDPDRLGQVVSTSYAAALAGQEEVTWERGTLGESARAKVPVYPPGGGDPVGEVSVGFEAASVFDDVPAALAGIGVAAGAALALGAIATLLLRRRWERLTLGLQPEELVALVQQQAAVLDGVGDGVIALDPDGVVRVCSATAARLLDLDDAVGRRLDDLELPDSVRAALADGSRDPVVAGDRVLFVERRPVLRDRRALGDIVIVRDRTDLEELSERLDSVRVLTSALRVQRHEFANRVHVAVGLLEADRADDARAFLDELGRRGAVAAPVPGLERVGDAFLQSLLAAKGIEAAERGVELRVSADTLIVGRLDAVEDAAAVIGNLIDNAVTAALATAPPGWVEVELLDDGVDLVVAVADSGDGVAPGQDVFARRPAAETDAVHGHGIGLPLSRDLARRRGGDVWVLDPGGAGSGAVLGARLPGAMSGTVGARETAS